MDYIFDYGGTLDSNGNHWGMVIWHSYEKCNAPVSEEHYRDAYVHAERTLGRERIIMPEFTFYDTLSTKLRIQLQYITDNDLWTIANTDANTLHKLILNDLYSTVKATVVHSRDILQQLAAHHRLALVSNFYGNINTILKEFQLDGLFVSVVESAVVGIRKPDPRIFALGVEALGCAPADVTVVGDSLDKDIMPALSLGCKAIWYKGEPWKAASAEESEAVKAQNIRIISDLAELL